ncbi:hypothetical protein ACLOJK_004295 [Asimina triloba]
MPPQQPPEETTGAVPVVPIKELVGTITSDIKGPVTRVELSALIELLRTLRQQLATHDNSNSPRTRSQICSYRNLRSSQCCPPLRNLWRPQVHRCCRGTTPRLGGHRPTSV